MEKIKKFSRLEEEYRQTLKLIAEIDEMIELEKKYFRPCCCRKIDNPLSTNTQKFCEKFNDCSECHEDFYTNRRKSVMQMYALDAKLKAYEEAKEERRLLYEELKKEFE